MQSKFLLLLLCSTAALHAEVKAIKNFVLIDGTGRAAAPKSAMLVDNGRISWIGPASRLSAPSGAETIDLHGKYVAKHQPAAIAGMEGLFKTETGAGIVLIGQPNEETGEIDNPLVVNNVLSFLIYGTTKAEVTGLDRIPRDQ